MTNNDNAPWDKLVIALVVLVPLLAFQAVVLKCLYQWFIMPMVHTPYISVTSFMGLLVIKSFFNKKSKDDSDEGMFQKVLQVVIWNLLYWGIGAVIHYWLT